MTSADREPVGAAAEVGHVDGHATAALKCADRLGQDLPRGLQVFDVAGRDVADPQVVLVGLAREVGRASALGWLLRHLVPGEVVEYDPEVGSHGQLRAVHVRPVYRA